MSAREIADEIGLHINTVRFHLDVLERQGTVVRQDVPAAGPGRPPARYAVTPGSGRDGLRNYKLLSEMLLAHLAGDEDPRQSAIDAGAQWGRYLIQPPAPGQRLTPAEGLGRLVDLLSDIGFDPVPDGPTDDQRDEQGIGTAVTLRHCPFLELADTHRDLVCTLHFGLMTGALQALKVPVTAVSLTPFARPNGCVAALRTAVPASKGPGR